MDKTISRATVERLPIYYRELELAEEAGVQIISSSELGRRLEITPEQIRKDLVSFGQFGRKGIGYEVSALRNSVGKILGLNHRWRLAIIGAGNLGTALASYNFSALGFSVAALFDADPKIIGTEINNLRVYDFAKFKPIAGRKLIDIGVIAVPEIEAQDVADVLIKAGIRGIWNFASIKIETPPEVALINVDLTASLSVLSFYLARNSK